MVYIQEIVCIYNLFISLFIHSQVNETLFIYLIKIMMIITTVTSGAGPRAVGTE